MEASTPVTPPAARLLTLVCLLALAAAVASESWRWSRTAPPAAGPSTVNFSAPPPLSLTELSHTLLPMPKGVPAAHASTLASLPRGDLIAFWWAGSRESGPDVKVYASRWSNGHWSAEWQVASRDSLAKMLGHGVRRIGNPVAWTARDGSIHLYVVVTGMGGWAAARVVQLQSRDGGASFQALRMLPMSPVFNTSVLVRTAPVELADGGWWLPVYFEIGNKYPMLMSFDAQGVPRRLTRIGTETNLLQASIVPVSLTEVRAWMRDAGAQGVVQQALSRDGGESWQDTEDSRDLANHDTSLAVLRLSSGNLVMLHNHLAAGGSERSTLSLSVSDDGHSWRPLANIASGKAGDEFSYPSMYQVGDELHITYTWQRRAIAHHRLKIQLGSHLR